MKIFGSPVQPEFCDWAFNRSRGRIGEQCWSKIPPLVDILVTHGPPLGRGDRIGKGFARGRAGCAELLHAVQHGGWGRHPPRGRGGSASVGEGENRGADDPANPMGLDFMEEAPGAAPLHPSNEHDQGRPPLLHVFGHIHEDADDDTSDGRTAFVNAATCDLRYKTTNAVKTVAIPVGLFQES